jgi:hypothetical protein
MPRRKWKKLDARPVDTSMSDEVLEQIRTGQTTFIEVLKTRVPSMQDQAYWRVERERAEKAEQVAKRLARRAARDDPQKRARQAAAFKVRMDAIAARKAARLVELAAADEKRKAALAQNPTLAWRHPRRKDWAKKNLIDAK